MQEASHSLENSQALIDNTHTLEELETVRVALFGKKGQIPQALAGLRHLRDPLRATQAQQLHQIRADLQQRFEQKKKQLTETALSQKLETERLDITLPGRIQVTPGGLHPLTQTILEIEQFFVGCGFIPVEGPEMEDAYHNFDALNIPAEHPARADHDTFWFANGALLRSQTSNVQIHFMENNPPPIRIIAPGRVYRKDYDATHTPMFHQIEVLMVDEFCNFVSLKGLLERFLTHFFGETVPIRFRPSYFPFTEPSAEVDIQAADGKWLEVLGCGMVHPTVLENVGINPERYRGFAMGLGVERLTMLKHGLADLRAFFDNDLRFLKRFH